MTSQPLQLLLKFTKRVLFLCSGAGEQLKASAAAVTALAREVDGECRVALLPAGMTPAYGLKKGLAAKVQAAMAKTQPVNRHPANQGA